MFLVVNCRIRDFWSNNKGGIQSEKVGNVCTK